MSFIAGGPATSSQSRSSPVQATAAAIAPRAAAVETAVAVASPAIMAASIDRINAALEDAVAKPPPGTGTLRVCHATGDEWDATGEIHIIEFARTPHGKYIPHFARTAFTERNISRWLQVYVETYNSQGRQWCPDLSYGPIQRTPGSVLPPVIPVFDDFQTIKVEVGVSQLWGMAPGQLDHKAISIWATVPGVEYVLCVKFDPDFTNAEYKLYDVQANPLVELDPVPIVAPRTEVQFDGCRALGIPQGIALPVGFPEMLTVDLYYPLVMASR